MSHPHGQKRRPPKRRSKPRETVAGLRRKLAAQAAGELANALRKQCEAVHHELDCVGAPPGQTYFERIAALANERNLARADLADATRQLAAARQSAVDYKTAWQRLHAELDGVGAPGGVTVEERIRLLAGERSDARLDVAVLKAGAELLRKERDEAGKELYDVRQSLEDVVYDKTSSGTPASLGMRVGWLVGHLKAARQETAAARQAQAAAEAKLKADVQAEIVFDASLNRIDLREARWHDGKVRLVLAMPPSWDAEVRAEQAKVRDLEAKLRQIADLTAAHRTPEPAPLAPIPMVPWFTPPDPWEPWHLPQTICSGGGGAAYVTGKGEQTASQEDGS